MMLLCNIMMSIMANDNTNKQLILDLNHLNIDESITGINDNNGNSLTIPYLINENVQRNDLNFEFDCKRISSEESMDKKKILFSCKKHN